MNLETSIRPLLWGEVKDSYLTKDYCTAILNGIHHLSEILREKSGCDGDGQSLVGAALGGDSPRLRINKLQTQSEKDAQAGLLLILKGIYQSIRNPRSHGKIDDTIETADSVILFINYLIGIIDQSAAPFTVDNFLSKVFDKHFVHSPMYTKLLVDEIPTHKRFDALIEIYRKKQIEFIVNISCVIEYFMNILSDEYISDFLSIVSDELMVIESEDDVQMNIRLLPHELWPKLKQVSRLRIENIITKSINDGEASIKKCCWDGNGELGRHAIDLLKYFEQKQVMYTIIKKMDRNEFECLYVFHFFLDIMPDLYNGSIYENNAIKTICAAINKYRSAFSVYDDKNNYVLDGLLKESFFLMPEKWQNSIKEELHDPSYGDLIPF